MEIRDKIERVEIDKLVPYARNSRTHSDAQVAQIAASMREWGWTNPVLVDEHGGIIAGHGRVLAARQLGLAEVPVIVARGWSEAQKRAYVIADNKLVLNAGWDEGMLRVELGDLQSMEFNLDMAGFDADELSDLFDGAVSLELPEAPDEVKKTEEHIKKIRDQRRNANTNTADKNDTEHYLVIVYDTREQREKAVTGLGLPADERYIHHKAIRVTARLGSQKATVSSDRSIKAADASKSGAGG